MIEANECYRLSSILRIFEPPPPPAYEMSTSFCPAIGQGPVKERYKKSKHFTAHILAYLHT